MIDIKDLCNEGWYADNPYGGSSFVIPLEELEDFIVKLKLDFEKRLSDAVNDAYDEGYLNGYNPE